MKKITFILPILLTTSLLSDVIVIAHANVPKIDTKTISKIFTGKTVIVNNIPITPFNFDDVNLRNDFLQKFVGMNEEEYIAYWTVRQYIGKGTEPKKINPVAAMILQIKNTPGAIGYISSKDLQEGLNIIEKR